MCKSNVIYGAHPYIADDDYRIDFPLVPDELEPLHDRVFDWMNVEDDSDGTYAVLIPQPFEDAWFGDVGGKTPKAVRPALPTTPNIRVSRP